MKTALKPATLHELWKPIRSGRQLMQWRKSIKINRPVFAALSGCSERSVATQEAKSRLSLTKERKLNEAHRLLLGLCEIMEPTNVVAWLNAPNEWLADRTPLEAVNEGKIDKVWELIHHTKSSGYA